MKLLLLGGGGFIGRTLWESFHERHEVISVDSAKPAATTRELALRLADTAELGRLIRRDRFDAVIHLVSTLLPSSPTEEIAREEREVVRPTVELLRICAGEGVPLVFFSSGGTVYGESGVVAVREDAPTAPICAYGFVKILLEEHIKFAQRVQGLRYLILRPSNPYGFQQIGTGKQGLIRVALARAHEGRPIDLWGSGDVVRDYLEASDLAHGVEQLLIRGIENRTLNIGSGQGTSLDTVLQIVREETGCPLPVNQLHRRATDVHSNILDVTALSGLIDWHPMTLREGVRRLVARLQQE